MASSQPSARSRPPRLRRRYLLLAPVLALAIGFGTVWTNAFGAADRLDLFLARMSSTL